MVQGKVGQLPPPPAAPPDEKLDFIIQQLQRLVEIGELLTGQAVPAIIQPIIPLPLDIELLNTLIQATRYEGKVEISEWRLTWNCPAGVITQVPLTLPTGMVCTRRFGKLECSATSEDILANVYVDRKPVAAFGLPLTTTPIIFDFAEGYVKREVVMVECDNGAAFDTRLTLQMTCNMMDKSFYESFYEPLFEKVYNSIEQLTK
ncbi:hypothetical protein ES703_121909 [subsurface metagenome]